MDGVLIFGLGILCVVLASALVRAWVVSGRVRRANEEMEFNLGSSEEEVKVWKRRAREAEEARRVEIRRPVPSRDAVALGDEEFCAVWRGVREDDRLLLAVKQVLARELVAQIDKVSDPRMAGKPGELAHAAGGLEWGLVLASNLEAVKREPERWCFAGKTQKVEPRRE